MQPLIRNQRSIRFPTVHGFCKLGCRRAALAVCLAVCVGCRQSAPPAGQTRLASAETPVATVSVARAAAPAPSTAQEFWDAFFLQGAKIGYAHTRVRPAKRDGRELVEMQALNHLVVSRFGQQAEQEVRMTTLETPAGQLLEFTTEIASGASLVKVSGRVEGDQLLLETESKGRRQTTRMPWSGEVQGFRAVEASLEREPLAPGQKRTLKMLMPLVNQVAEVDLLARDFETTSVLGVETRLLRVDSVARLPGGQSMNSTLWLDAQGQAIKTHISAFNQESFRTSRELAEARATGTARFDLGSDLIVKPNRPMMDPYQTRQVRYRVELADGNPAQAFASGSTQSVQPLDEHAAEVTVRSVRPGSAPAPGAAAPTPDAKFTAANSVLQSDDAKIIAMAREGRGGATRPSDVAIALERYVHQAVTKKDFSQAFATAAEVAESREGDCTEHAVLLAALLRACEIPSRVAIGLVYVESAGGFGYHMWTEAYLEGQWIPLDAIMGRGGISAAYLKLTDSSLEGASAYSSFLPVAQVVGQLKISILESEQ